MFSRKILFFLREIYLFAEAFFILNMSYVLVSIIKPKYYFRFIGNYIAKPGNNFNPLCKVTTAVNRAVRRARRYSPFNVKCFPVAITTKKMLDNRNVYNVLYIGVKKEEQGELKAHAWTVFSDKKQENKFKIIAHFE